MATRSKLMLKAADILESRLEEFALAESKDNGKPVWLARSVDIPRAVSNMRFFATSILHYYNKYVKSNVTFEFFSWMSVALPLNNSCIAYEDLLSWILWIVSTTQPGHLSVWLELSLPGTYHCIFLLGRSPLVLLLVSLLLIQITCQLFILIWQ